MSSPGNAERRPAGAARGEQTDRVDADATPAVRQDGGAAPGMVEADLTRERARELVDTVKVSLAAIDGALVAAYRGRAWLALGYPSWDAMCAAEFAGARLRVPREDRAEQVASLRSSGLSTRAIGAAIGVGKGTVQRALAGAPDGALAESITGQNGKTYAPTQPAPRPRRPITTAWREGADEADRAVRKLLRLADDDRFAGADLRSLVDLRRSVDQLFAAVAEKEAGR